MADVSVASQLQQWTFEKPTHSERSASSSSSPNLSHHEPEALRIDASVAAAVKAAQDMDSKDFQDRYLSSEEDLSPMYGNSSDSEYESDASIHDVEKEILKARRLSVSRWDKGLSCDMAVSVSYVSAGRPKVIELNVGPPAHEKKQRAASFAQLPIAAVEKLRKEGQQTKHRSMLLTSASASASRSPSPAVSTASRRHSQRPPYAHSNTSRAQLSQSTTSFQTASSVRSPSPADSEYSIPSRPTSAATSHLQPHPPRASSSFGSNANRTLPFPPLTPQSPEPHSFLNSDPFESSTTNAASPIIRNGGTHRRLRSISQKLSLAKIAITPSTKKWDSRINGKPGAAMPPTPKTPFTPMTPQTAPATTDSSPMRKLRRNSRILLSRPPTRGATTTPELPTIPISSMPANPAPLKRSATEKLVARGANERAPTLELPPFPSETSSMSSTKNRPLRKRKSLMDLL
ncbi:hypothetical protein CC80DRAFT_129470 [Byssothecium circinans]|uniref:Uncharacterized protein n=1 Tax=Byssothecium circinans TaxID=147558 RepID=A0A6A5TP16_9PLEO|nr:hypothetical protein CC80DRAFT_129470 [Byssothecium circinans]